MKQLMRILVVFLLSGVTSAFAGVTDPLFINLTTGDAHRSQMAINFGNSQLGRGHPLIIYLNDNGVLLAAKQHAGEFAEQQKALEAAIGKGATVIICPTCMKGHGIKEDDLLPGIKVGNPELTGNALFQDNAKILSW